MLSTCQVCYSVYKKKKILITPLAVHTERFKILVWILSRAVPSNILLNVTVLEKSGLYLTLYR